jgi:hypothetical protein
VGAVGSPPLAWISVSVAGPDRATRMPSPVAPAKPMVEIDRALGRRVVAWYWAPSFAATDDRLTMTPPLPPWRRRHRFTASRAQNTGDVDRHRLNASADIVDARRPPHDAAVIGAPSVPN